MASQHQFVKIVNGYPTIDIGAMRHEITIQSEGVGSPPVIDASGVVVSPQTFVTATAAIDYVRGLDVIKGGQTTSQAFLSAAIWFQAGIIGGMKVINDNGSTYIVQSVDNVLEMDVVLILNCVGLGANE